MNLSKFLGVFGDVFELNCVLDAEIWLELHLHMSSNIAGKRFHIEDSARENELDTITVDQI